MGKNTQNKTVKSFWEAFERYILEELNEAKKYFGDFDRNQILAQVDKVAVIADWENDEKSHITSVIEIYYKDEQVGRYQKLFTISGEAYDESFVCDGLTTI